MKHILLTLLLLSPLAFAEDKLVYLCEPVNTSRVFEDGFVQKAQNETFGLTIMKDEIAFTNSYIKERMKFFTESDAISTGSNDVDDLRDASVLIIEQGGFINLFIRLRDTENNLYKKTSLRFLNFFVINATHPKGKNVDASMDYIIADCTR